MRVYVVEQKRKRSKYWVLNSIWVEEYKANRRQDMMNQEDPKKKFRTRPMALRD